MFMSISISSAVSISIGMFFGFMLRPTYTLSDFITVCIISVAALIAIRLIVDEHDREALLAGIAIPLSFLITITVLSLLGLTLNFLSLFSLILSLGLLIDGAIIMVEGMHEQLWKRRKSPKEAALTTVKTFQAPLTTGILTTVFAFVPMRFSQ